MTKLEAYRILSANGAAWIGNVLFTRASRRNTAALKKLATVALAGGFVAPLSFQMPDEHGVLIDGRHHTIDQVLALPDDVDARDLETVSEFRALTLSLGF